MRGTISRKVEKASCTASSSPVATAVSKSRRTGRQASWKAGRRVAGTFRRTLGRTRRLGLERARGLLARAWSRLALAPVDGRRRGARGRGARGRGHGVCEGVWSVQECRRAAQGQGWGWSGTIADCRSRLPAGVGNLVGWGRRQGGGGSAVHGRLRRSRCPGLGPHRRSRSDDRTDR